MGTSPLGSTSGPLGSRSGASRDAAVELLLAEPERLEPGLVGLDADLKLDEHVTIDALLRDSLGYPVVVLFVGEDVARELGRMAAVAEALQRGRYLLTRLYHNKGIDPALRPRFVLLGTRFPDSAPRLLDMMAQVEVHAVEYRVVKSSVGRPVLDLNTFHRTAGGALGGSEWGTSGRPASKPSTPARREARRPEPPRAKTPVAEPAPPVVPDVRPVGDELIGATPSPAPASAPPPASRPTGDDGLELLDDDMQGPDQARSLYLRARDSIRSLSSDVKESRENGQVVFKVDERTIAALALDDDGLKIQVGDERVAGDVFVTDDKAFNDRLNSIFTLYFDAIGLG